MRSAPRRDDGKCTGWPPQTKILATPLARTYLSLSTKQRRRIHSKPFRPSLSARGFPIVTLKGAGQSARTEPIIMTSLANSLILALYWHGNHKRGTESNRALAESISPGPRPYVPGRFPGSGRQRSFLTV